MSELNTITGKTVLHVGNEAKNWTVADFTHAAQNARKLGIDTLCVKRADGTIDWSSNYAAEREAVLAAGCGYIPMVYCYGPKFGLTQAIDEANLCVKIARECAGFVCADMEAEWNGQSGIASHFAAVFSDKNVTLYVSTWADPNEQNWQDVLRELESVASAFCPQQYNDFLANQEWQFKSVSKPLMPTFDLTQEFGANNQIAHAQQAVKNGHETVWLWEYVPALLNPKLTADIVAIMNGSVSPTPPPTGTDHTYTIVVGDTLVSIAEKLTLGNWYSDLYLPNMAVIEAAARAHGYPDSERGNLIFPGTVLEYR